MKLCFIGTGYVGLVTGTCFAEVGNHVTCIDIDEKKINALNNGKVPIYEPGLDHLIERNIAAGRLTFSMDTQEVVRDSDIIFIAVGTPPGEDGSADLKYVYGVAKEIGMAMTSDKIIVNKSTVPVGTGAEIEKIIQNCLKEKGMQIEFSVVSNPEFLREGSAIFDFMNPDRVIIGNDNAKTLETMKNLYNPFMQENSKVITMDRVSSELTKYASNSFLATKISFMNELSILAEAVGADINDIRNGMGTDHRIGQDFLFPGPGYGGSCFPKDVQALQQSAHHNNINLEIIQSVSQVNDRQKTVLFRKLKQAIENLENKTIAIWGLAFKPKTDDMRESAAIDLINALVQEKSTINAFDPEAMSNAAEIFGDKVNFAKDMYHAVHNADALIIVTDWPEFKKPEFDQLNELMKGKIIVDGRNLYSLKEMRTEKFDYYSIGRSSVKSNVKD